MKRFLPLGALAVAASAVVFGLFAPVALADPPTRIGPGPIPDFTLSGFCAFPVLVHIDTNKEVTTTFSDGHQLVTGSLKATLTNTTSGHSQDFNISGPGTFWPQPDGTLVQKAVGRWIWFFPANQLGTGSPPMLILTTGHVTVVANLDGTQTFTQQGGTITDLCSALV